MTLTFVYLKPFLSDARRLGLDDADLERLEQMLMAHPTAGDVVASTGGVRKVRFAPARKGKRGGQRVIYALLAERATVYFFLAYGKNEQGNLTAEQKAACKAMMGIVHQHFGTKG